jgi:hypothetical protein
MFARDNIGLSHLLVQDKVYNPDSSIFNNGKRTIQIEKPGIYELIGTASFSVMLSNGERKDYKISSEPYKITVK